MEFTTQCVKCITSTTRFKHLVKNYLLSTAFKYALYILSTSFFEFWFYAYFMFIWFYVDVLLFGCLVALVVFFAFLFLLFVFLYFWFLHFFCCFMVASSMGLCLSGNNEINMVMFSASDSSTSFIFQLDNAPANYTPVKLRTQLAQRTIPKFVSPGLWPTNSPFTCSERMGCLSWNTVQKSTR